MSKLLFYSVFHGNLNYSYVAEDLYPQIIERCYWPLLRMAKELEIPLGLEFSAYTLQEIDRLDHSFVQELSRLWRQGACEVIGSGYVQAIMPLIPSRVNRENLRLGNAVYEQLLGRRPTIAYLNEQVYSAGLPQLYHEAGYQALVVNWDSSLPAHVDHEMLYRPCAVSREDGGRIPIIWHCLSGYRDFQQYIEREISLDDYLSRLDSNIPDSGLRSFPIYSSDWEVFDFKPWRVYPDGFRQPELGEMDRIAALFDLLKQREDIEFVAPSFLLQRFPNLPMVQLESSEWPMPYKKQAQHAVTRWAVGGRDNTRVNTQCHQLYEALLLAEWNLERRGADSSLMEECRDLWKELCYLWASDFRTFTTEDKYLTFRNRMGATLTRAGKLSEALQPDAVAPGQVLFSNCSPVPATNEPTPFSFYSNGSSMSGVPGYELRLKSETVPCQVTGQSESHHGGKLLSLEAAPAVGAASVEVGTIQQSKAPSHTRASACSIDRQRSVIETPAVRLSLESRWGGSIQSLAFPQIAPEPLVLQPVDYPPSNGLETGQVQLGGLTIKDWMGQRVSDHQAVEIEYPDLGQPHEIFVPVRCLAQTESGWVWKTYRVYIDQPRVDLIIRFQLLDVVPKSFRLGTVALNPRAFDKQTLHYTTTIGGEKVEQFRLAGQCILQDQPAGPDVTASGCLGATEGWVAVGDAAKGVGLVTRLAGLYSVPLLHYQEMNDGPEGFSFSLTLTHSLGEQDQTSHTLWRGHSTWRLSILGGAGDLVSKTRSSALLSNGGLVPWVGNHLGPHFPDQPHGDVAIR